MIGQFTDNHRNISHDFECYVQFWNFIKNSAESTCPRLANWKETPTGLPAAWPRTRVSVAAAVFTTRRAVTGGCVRVRARMEGAPPTIPASKPPSPPPCCRGNPSLPPRAWTSDHHYATSRAPAHAHARAPQRRRWWWWSPAVTAGVDVGGGGRGGEARQTDGGPVDGAVRAPAVGSFHSLG